MEVLKVKIDFEKPSGGSRHERPKRKYLNINDSFHLKDLNINDSFHLKDLEISKCKRESKGR
jgi:hypothetical protein